MGLQSRADVNGILYFIGGSSGGLSLWRTDGTVVGTYPVRGSSAGALVAMSPTDQLYSSGTTLYYTTDNQTKLWSLAGADADTLSSPIAIPVIGNRALNGIGNLLVAGNSLFFTAADTTDSYSPVRSGSIASVLMNTSGVRVTTSTVHGLVTNDVVNLSGLNGIAGVNGRFTIRVIDATSFELNGAIASGLYLNGGTWTSASRVRLWNV